MQLFSEYIIFTTLTLVVLITLITLTRVKFAGVCEVHKHEVPVNLQSDWRTPILDCKFYKFKVIFFTFNN